MTRQMDVRLAIRLFLLGVLGVLTLVLLPLPNSKALMSLVQPFLLLIVAIVLGTLVDRQVGLGAPILSEKFDFEEMKPRLKDVLKFGGMDGAGLGVVLMGISLVSEIGMTGRIHHQSPSLDLSFITALLYGGLSEEIMMRFGLMTLIVWLIFKITKSKADWVFVAAILLSSFLFAAGHLPIAYAHLETVSWGVLAYILIANSTAGVVYGYLYWKKGLECSMMAHMMTHISWVSVHFLFHAAWH